MNAPPEGGPATEAEMEAGMAAKPDRGQADDGKAGGESLGGQIGTPATGGDGAGINVQSGEKSGTETERNAPGMSTDKKADDTK